MDSQDYRYDISDIRMRCARWFSAEAMKFFRSRIGATVYQGPGGVYFISSERFSMDTSRKFSVRRFFPDTNRIQTIGEFNVLTRTAAVRLAKACAEGEIK